MEPLPHVANGDVVLGLGQAVTALESLLGETTTHADVPSETRRCLDEMVECVRGLAAACARIERSGPAGRAAASAPDPVDGTAAERRGLGLRDLVGADLIDQLEQGGPSAVAANADPSERWIERTRTQHPHHPTRARLTPQEQRILDLIAEGCTNRQIAGQLYLAEKTVKNYVSNMLRKLGMERRTQAAVYAAHLHRGPVGAAVGTVS